MDTPRFKLLEQELETTTEPRDRVDIMVEMGVELRSFDVEGALHLANEIIDLSGQVGYTRGAGRGLNLRGSCLGLQGESEAGLEVLHQAQTVAREVNDRKLEARVLNNFGIIYRDRGEFATALSYFERALAINEELGDDFAQSVNLTSISNLLYDLNDFESALEYAQRCLPIFERAHDLPRLIQIYNTLGNIYFKQDAFEDALHFFKENLAQSEENTPAYVMAQSGMGKVFYKMQDFDNAAGYLSHALEHAQALGNLEVQIICHFYLGKMNMDDSHYRRAQGHLEAAFVLATDYSRRHDVMSIHEVLSILYDKMGDIPKAFHHLKTYERVKEEIFQQATLSKLRNLQIRQQTELAQKEKEVAERTAQLKQQFMANMSHEIRTPMNAITGMTRLLLQKEPKQEQLRYLNAIQQSADNLLVIINDILDLSKIEAGKIIIEQTDFSLREIMQGARDVLMFKAEERNIELKLYTDDRLPHRLFGDPTRINQILINLAGNAVKFTERGHVAINASLAKKENNTYWLQFDVEDTGIGIATEYVDQIFESFTQAGTDVTRKFGGTGLGLTISKQLITLMQGTISVKSEYGKGTTFTVIIPLEASQQQDLADGMDIDSEQLRKALKDLKVLLVEDNEFNRMVAEDTLDESLDNVSIDIAVNGAEAVEKVQLKQYDIVLMDIQMPVMDGVTATKEIRKLAAPAGTVNIIAMTANVLQEDVKQYMQIGMNGYVAKPFKTEQLLQTIASLMPKQEDEKLTKEHNTSQMSEEIKQDEPAIPASVTDMEFLRGFTGGKEDKIRKYVGMFLENAPKLLQQVDEMLEQKDFPALKIAAHSLKPQLSYMGVKEEVSHIFLIEQTANEAVHCDRLPPLIDNLHKVCAQAFKELAQAIQTPA
jgi:signal transduction histidine kinase/CheY-like chemotaxis protein/HPt (histidine-containing phosphotransfer) domain-containing protein